MAKINKSLNYRESKIHKDLNFFGESPYSGLVASNLTDENDPHHIYVKYSGKKEESSTFQIPVSEYEGKEVKINGNKLIIGDDVVCSWADDNEGSIIEPKLTLNGKEIPQGHIISGKGKLTITITDDSDKKKTRDIKINNIINQAPEVKVIKPEVDVTGGKKVEVQNNNLLLGGDKVLEWSDDHTQNCTVTLSLNGNDVNHGDTLNEGGTLTIRVINKDGYESIRDINLHALHDISANSLSDEKIRIIRNGLMHESYTVDGDKLYINNPTSYPTAIEAMPLKNFLSTIITNHPGCTREEAIKIITDNYLVEKQYKYKDVDGNIKEGPIYSIDIDKFYKDEVKKSPKKD